MSFAFPPTPPKCDVFSMALLTQLWVRDSVLYGAVLVGGMENVLALFAIIMLALTLGRMGSRRPVCILVGGRRVLLPPSLPNSSSVGLVQRIPIFNESYNQVLRSPVNSRGL